MSGKLEYAWQGPERGVARVTDRAVLLAHGAGADMHAPTLTTVTDALSAAGIPSLRFRYPYRSGMSWGELTMGFVSCGFLDTMLLESPAIAYR